MAALNEDLNVDFISYLTSDRGYFRYFAYYRLREALFMEKNKAFPADQKLKGERVYPFHLFTFH
ncbi:hypothetical protein V7122_04580 [Bacillus sp. JJ1532]|uniref:hypothetical protein n=1 Tax=unclassified Bacillus (in: firmicutes) TaxID=185979 RepID=UPI002FFF6A2B